MVVRTDVIMIIPVIIRRKNILWCSKQVPKEMVEWLPLTKNSAENVQGNEHPIDSKRFSWKLFGHPKVFFLRGVLGWGLIVQVIV